MVERLDGGDSNLVAIVEQDKDLRKFLDFELSKRTGIEFFDDVGIAIEYLRKTPYSAIYVNCSLKPNKETDNAEISRIIRQGEPDSLGFYIELAEYLVKSARSIDSPNRETPILIYGTHISPDIQELYLSAGATRCVELRANGEVIRTAEELLER